MAYEECTVVGRNAVMEAYRSGKTIDKLFILDGCQDGPIKSILREARKRDTLIKFVSKEKLDSLSSHEKHQGVVAIAAAYEYATVEDLFKKAEEKGEAPFFILCDEIEDPYRKPRRRTRRNHSKKTCSRTYQYRCKSICRCIKLHTSSSRNKPFQNN